MPCQFPYFCCWPQGWFCFSCEVFLCALPLTRLFGSSPRSPADTSAPPAGAELTPSPVLSAGAACWRMRTGMWRLVLRLHCRWAWGSCVGGGHVGPRSASSQNLNCKVHYNLRDGGKEIPGLDWFCKTQFGLHVSLWNVYIKPHDHVLRPKICILIQKGIFFLLWVLGINQNHAFTFSELHLLKILVVVKAYDGRRWVAGGMSSCLP